MKELVESLLKLHASLLREELARGNDGCTCLGCRICENYEREAKKKFRDFRYTLARLVTELHEDDAAIDELHSLVLNYPLGKE